MNYQSRRYLYDSKLTKKVKIIEILIAMVITVLGVISLINYNALKQTISTEIASYGLIGLFFVTVVIELIPTIFNPLFGLAVTLASGINFYISTVVCISAVFLGGLLGFQLGKKYGFRLVCAMSKKETVEKILTFKERYGNLFMVLSAFSPLPYYPILFGAVLVDKKDFVVYGLISRILFVVIASYFIKIGLINNL